MPCVWTGWGPLKRLLLPLLLLCLRQECLVAGNSDANDTSTLQNSTCNQSHCLHCDLKTEKCVKCLYVIVASSRLCLTSCPAGFSTSWPSDSDLLGRVCKERSMLALISGRDVTIIAGAAVGGAVCVGVVIGALLYMKRRAKPAPCYPPPEPRQRYPIPRLWKDRRPNATEKPVADEERVEFLEQLACLRGEATNFLEMLSHTQTRFRSLGSPDSPTDTKAKAYRAVVRDLSRVLTLLNRREEHILTVPGDWRRLLSWAARVLARYKRQKTMKESGDLPTLDPLYAGGTLYQTRRQTQAQRCRLVTQGAPPPLPAATPTPPSTHRDSPLSCQGTPIGSQMGSRSNSMVSLTPIILEEAEEEMENGTRDTEPFETAHYNLDFETTDRQTQEAQNKYLRGNTDGSPNNYNNYNYYKPPTHLSQKGKQCMTIREQILNLRNMEQRQEARNVDKYLTPEGSPVREHTLVVGTAETQQQESPGVTLGPTVFERSAVNAVLPGRDVYTNVIRKPVLPTVILAGDPYRDDTIDRKEHLRRETAAGQRRSPRSCKMQARRQVAVPRCELTTDL